MSSTLPECSICIDILNIDYTILICGHKFCTHCLVEWERTQLENEMTTSCALCRKEYHNFNYSQNYYKNMELGELGEEGEIGEFSSDSEMTDEDSDEDNKSEIEYEDI